MVAEITPKFVAEDTCPRCGGIITDFVLPPEKGKCIECGFRLYEESLATEASGDGRLVRIRYKGDVKSLKRLQPMAAVILPHNDRGRASTLRLGVMCPMCRGIDELSMMRQLRGQKERWICAVGHTITLHRGIGQELVGWS
ncbi:MAG: hypothetical protein OXI16_14030 [Chloroflexota bacterium]|nr:hypothetical protein [Chloroflexota bacterium]